jgi:hypothetical protein
MRAVAVSWQPHFLLPGHFLNPAGDPGWPECTAAQAGLLSAISLALAERQIVSGLW